MDYGGKCNNRTTNKPSLYSVFVSDNDGFADELKELSDIIAIICQNSYGLCCMNNQRWNVSNLK